MIGKSEYQRILAEAYLAAGKTVLEVTKDGSFLKKRRRHLTLIEEIKAKDPAPVWVDEWPLREGS